LGANVGERGRPAGTWQHPGRPVRPGAVSGRVVAKRAPDVGRRRRLPRRQRRVDGKATDATN